MSAYYLAKIHAKLSRMLKDSDVEALANADVESVIRQLQDSSYGEFLSGQDGMHRVSDRLRRGFIADLSSLVYALNGHDRILLLDVLSYYRVENLKTILRVQLHRLPAEDAKRHLFELPWDHVDFEKWLGIPGLESLIKELPWEEYRNRLEAVHRQVSGKGSVFPYEAELDAMYLHRLIHHCQLSKLDVKRILKNRVLKDLLLWAFRMKSYGYTFPELVNILPDYRPLIPHDDMRRLIEDSEGWHEMARFFDPAVAQEIEQMDDLDLHKIGVLFDRQLVQAVEQALISAPMGMGIVVGYVYRKELELTRAIELVERVRITQ
jgi:vacuolar-type H+-ATPase subunit C/Vma6